jgi:hypothetical protein
MAQVTTTKLVEGPSVIVVQVDLLNNDASGELSNFTILSPSDLSPPKPNNDAMFRVMQIWYQMVWFDVSITTGGINPRKLWTLARDSTNHIDFRSFGGVTDKHIYQTPPGDDYGTLQLTTNGFATGGSQGSIILELRKLK